MQGKLVSLMFFFCFFAMVFANNPSINSIQEPIVLYGQMADFNVMITPDGTNGLINFTDNGTIIQQKNFVSSDTIIVFSKTWTNLGKRIISFSFINLDQNDTDLTNNSKTLDLNVLKDVDFKPVANNIPTVYQQGQTINFTVEIENIGERNFVGTATIGLFFDSNLVLTKNFLDLDVLHSILIDFNYTLPVDLNGSHTLMVQANPNNSIREFDYTNNSVSKVLQESSRANLLVQSLTYQGNITKGVMKTFSVIIKNDGGLTASNIIFRIYNDSMLVNNKLFETTIPYIEAKGTRNIDFSFIPIHGDSNQTLIAYVDPLNTIDEYNENDNVSQITFYIVDSNQEFDQATYVYVLEQLQGELETCRGSTYSIQLEKENALTSLAKKIDELTGCATNLHTCNSYNSTFLSNWSKDRDNNCAQAFAVLTETFNSNLERKDDDLTQTGVRCTEEKNVLIEGTVTESKNKDFFFGTTIFLVVLIIANGIIGQLRNKKARIEGK